MNFLAIEWDPSIGIDLGFFTIRWYSLMFVAAFMLGLHFMKKIYIEDKIPLEKLDTLFMYTFIWAPACSLTYKSLTSRRVLLTYNCKFQFTRGNDHLREI